MHPIYGKFQRFQNFKKYSYTDISRPDQSLKEELKNFATIYYNSNYRTTYVRDLKNLKEKPSSEVSKARKLQKYYRMHQVTDILIVSYAAYSFFWHYKKGYFHIQTNKKLPLIDLYILGKIVFNVIFFASASFFLLKKASDPIMYEYFQKKEKEWEENALRLAKEKEETGNVFRGVGDKRH